MNFREFTANFTTHLHLPVLWDDDIPIGHWIVALFQFGDAYVRTLHASKMNQNVIDDERGPFDLLTLDQEYTRMFKGLK